LELDEVAAVRHLLEEGVPQRQIVARLGVSKGAIWRISRGEPPSGPRKETTPRPLIVSPDDAERLAARVAALEAEVARLSAARTT